MKDFIREFVPYGMLQRESLDAWLASIPVVEIYVIVKL